MVTEGVFTLHLTMTSKFLHDLHFESVVLFEFKEAGGAAGLDAGDIGDDGGEGWGDSDLVLGDGDYQISILFNLPGESIKTPGV